MKTFCLILSILTTVHCDSIVRVSLLKSEGIFTAYDEYGAAVSGFNKTTVVKDDPESFDEIDDLDNGSPMPRDDCTDVSDSYKSYHEDGKSKYWKDLGRVTDIYRCDANGPDCKWQHQVTRTETASWSVSLSATWKGIITGTIGHEYSSSVSYSDTYNCDVKAGQCAYISMKTHKMYSRGRTTAKDHDNCGTCYTPWGNPCCTWPCEHHNVRVDWGKKKARRRITGF